jgi:hypothetical protein
MEVRFWIAFADSMRAMRRMGGGSEEDWEEVEGCRAGRVWRRTSVRNWRSDAELHLGRTRASRLGEWSCGGLGVSGDSEKYKCH